MKPDQFAEITDASKNIVAFLGGIRTRLINEGWSEGGR